jgi:hypothetical protein
MHIACLVYFILFNPVAKNKLFLSRKNGRDIYSPPHKSRQLPLYYKIRDDEMMGQVAYLGEMKRSYEVLARLYEGKMPLGRLSCRWEGNIRMGFQQMT